MEHPLLFVFAWLWGVLITAYVQGIMEVLGIAYPGAMSVAASGRIMLL